MFCHFKYRENVFEWLLLASLFIYVMYTVVEHYSFIIVCMYTCAGMLSCFVILKIARMYLNGHYLLIM